MDSLSELLNLWFYLFAKQFTALMYLVSEAISNNMFSDVS
jgi:hypothetical protein